jgi:hypothetical protein
MVIIAISLQKVKIALTATVQIYFNRHISEFSAFIISTNRALPKKIAKAIYKKLGRPHELRRVCGSTLGSDPSQTGSPSGNFTGFSAVPDVPTIPCHIPISG